jgi:hypothetical protein
VVVGVEARDRVSVTRSASIAQRAVINGVFVPQGVAACRVGIVVLPPTTAGVATGSTTTAGVVDSSKMTSVSALAVAGRLAGWLGGWLAGWLGGWLGV